MLVSLHRPTIYARIREAMRDAGEDDKAIEAAIQEANENDRLFDLLAKYGGTPQALSTKGGRDVMQRLTEGAGMSLTMTMAI